MILDMVKQWINRIKKSSFIKSVLSLSSGGLIGQVILTLSTPVIGRIYTASDMGDYTLIVSNANIIIAVSVLGMLTVFMLPKEDTEARELCRLVTLCSLIICSICVVFLYLISPYWKLLNTEGISYSVALIVLWIYVTSYIINNICYAYANRLKLYKVLFWNPIISAVVNMGLSILFGIMGLGFIGYTVASVISVFANIIHLIKHANPYSEIPDNKKIGYMNLLKSYSRFPKFQMPSNLVSSIANQIPLQILSTAFSSSVLGYYSMVHKLMSLPTSLLAVPINRVYFQEASKRYREGDDIGEFSFRILESNIKIAILPISILMVFGRWIFKIVLGAQWEQAGAYAAVLGIYFLIGFCSSCLSGSFVIIGKNSWSLISASTNAVIGILLFALVNIFPGISEWTFLFVMSVSFTIERIFEKGFFFYYTGFDLRRYVIFVVRLVVIPFILAYFIQLSILKFIY
ncbi:MAG: oligosaccharide flippase family protein [Dorea sp.]|nr:oligosaccharide flippase family protein [Dorea sp.]